MSLYKGTQLIAGTSVKLSHNIGDVFFTSRTDTILAGAVECNGATYQTTSYIGEGSIGELLAAGKLPYIPLSQYATDLAAHGSVRAFGWDGEGTTAFRVPTLQNIFLEAGQAASVGEYISAGLPNITASVSGIASGTSHTYSGAFYQTGTSGGTLSGTGGHHFNLGLDASRANDIYGGSNTVQPNSVKYRAMVQLYNGITDEALATCENVESDVQSLKTNAVQYCSYNTSTRILVTGTNQTAQKNGWIIGNIFISGTNTYLSTVIDGIEVSHSPWTNGAQWGCLSTCIPIKAGQTYRYNGNATIEQNLLYYYPND